MMAKSENTTGTLAQESPGGAVAIALTGGGARAAYQVGLLRCLAEMAPDYRFPIVTGVSAGAVNAAFRERENILAALQQTNRRVAGARGAAELLGIHPATLTSSMKKMRLQRPS